ncbi:hypothetical protein [Mycobacterium sp. CnD-18-1]|uniref:hypothetical protein n=1 Tax=Mycobacterium sp. CnD-18-1 TaxID=2917744 RepID=UPI001EF2EAA7|nr:hypothetical protein [Mycobacterium sp. CnD-18-1]MCG7607147.1 hypothetical protein [Mycobacterium sp. CnD-18-1]
MIEEHLNRIAKNNSPDDELQRSRELIDGFLMLMQSSDMSADDVSAMSSVAVQLRERAEERWESRLVDDALQGAMHNAIEQVAAAIHRTHADWCWEFGTDTGSDYHTRRDARKLLIEALSGE